MNKVTDVRFHFRGSGMWITFRYADGEETHVCLSHYDMLHVLDPDKWEKMVNAGTEFYFKPLPDRLVDGRP
jgi:hypothetical protein